MKYISRVILENFQSHKYTDMDLSQELNVIVGPSDTGKTAILRGIKWALFNEPSGDYFIREGESECSVTVFFNDGNAIKRYRSLSKNIYYIIDPKGNEMKFEGFGTSVPQEVTDITCMTKIFLDNTTSKSINMSDQLEGPFLLSEKGSVKASAIGKLVGVDLVDEALKEGLKDLRNLKIESKTYEERNEKLTLEMKEFEYLDDVKIQLESAIRLEKEIDLKMYNLKNLEVYKESLEKLTLEMKNIQENYLSKLEKINELDYLIRDLEYEYRRYRDIYKKGKSLDLISLENNSLGVRLGEVNKFIDLEGNLVYIKKLLETKKVFEDLRSKYFLNKSSIGEVETLITSLKNVDSVSLLYNDLEFLVKKELGLKALMGVYESNRTSISKGRDYIKAFDGLEELDTLIDKLSGAIEKSSKLGVLREKLDRNQEFKKINKKELANIDAAYSKYKEEYGLILKELKTCPFCLNSLDGKDIDHIMDHFN